MIQNSSPTNKIEPAQTPFYTVPKHQTQMLQPTFQDTLYLLSWNGYGKEAYQGSMACKETWTDERILFPHVLNMLFGKDERTLIGIYAAKSYLKKREEHLIERVKYLIQLGANPDVPSKVYQRTPLMEASLSCDNNSLEMFNYLLTHSVNINGSTDWGWNALSLASRHIGTKKMRLLLEKGADPNFMCDGRSVLNLTCCFHESNGKNSESIRILLENGADPNILDYRGETIIGHCLVNQFIDYAHLLIQHGAILPADDSLMNELIYSNNGAAIQFLVQHGKSIPPSKLIDKIAARNTVGVELLLRNGACPNAKVEGISPLSMVISEPYSESSVTIVKQLCMKRREKPGANVNEISEGMTLLEELFHIYINNDKNKNKYVLKMIEVLVLNGGKLPPMKKYEEILSYNSNKKTDFMEINLMYMKARGK